MKNGLWETRLFVTNRICGGRFTFKCTRIEITGTLERLAAGESMAEIIQGYRGRVTHEAIVEAIHLITTLP